MQITSNYHTHTYLCKHAEGTVMEYCEAAIQHGLKTLGFTDHTPYMDGRWNTVRMGFEQLPQYISAVLEAREKYKGQLRILLGMECEAAPDMFGYFKEILLDKYKLDYIIEAGHSYWLDDRWRNTFSGHMGDRELHAYTDIIIKGMESGLYSFCAHPDVFAVSYRGWNEDATSCVKAICQAANAYGIGLELNSYGFRKARLMDGDTERPPYPLPKFWEIATEENVSAIINSDAHLPQDVCANIDEALALATKYGIKVINDTLADKLEKK